MERPAPIANELALAIADVNWFTTEHLFREMDGESVPTLLLKCSDFRNALQAGLPLRSWRRAIRPIGPSMWQRDLVLPSGWMKQYPRLGMRPIGRTIRNWYSEHADDLDLTLVMTYPHYRYLRDQVRPDRSVYYNIDDYKLYWPRHAEEIRLLEHRLARESDVTICVARARAEELRDAVPEAADRIHHVPHGTPTGAVARALWHTPAPAPPDLSELPRPFLGYVGTLDDRVDWGLLLALARAIPNATLILIGKPDPHAKGDWTAARDACLERSNVRLLGWKTQSEIPAYSQCFDVCLIPYDVDHPFNKVCSPTKIMDFMGTGRPIVSTALPECRLYDHLFDVADHHDDFIEAVRAILRWNSDDGRTEARLAWARQNSCRGVARRILELIRG